MNQGLVSVIIAVFNGERFLKDAIDSVINQTYSPTEIIVVDDGSADKTAEIAQLYKEIRYTYQSNQGHPGAMNSGIEAANGEFIAFLDADDMWVPEKLEQEVDFLMNHPEIDYVIAKMKNFSDSDSDQPRPRTKDLLLNEYAGLVLGTMLARRTAFEQVGYFDSSFMYAKDVDWFIRAKEAGTRMGILPETVLLRRLHNSNMSYDIEQRKVDFLRVVKASINRKRIRESRNKSMDKNHYEE